MSGLSTPGLLGAVVVIVAVAAIVSSKATPGGKSASVAGLKRKALLTPNELEFLTRLEAAVPEFRFCPQVAMGALVEPIAPRRDRSAWYRARGTFSQKIVDFVAMDRATGAVAAVIELDDRTHVGPKDARRDAMLAGAGYRTVRWRSNARPDAGAIRLALMPGDGGAADPNSRP